MKKAACVVLFASALAVAAMAETKNYYFPGVRVEIAIQKDGSFLVDEYRTYEFQGRFSWADIRIPLEAGYVGPGREVSISEFAVSDENGRALKVESSARNGVFAAKWYYSAANERRTFHIHYRMRGGIISYPEVTELCCQVIGSWWERPTKKVVIDVRLPVPLASKGDLKVWGHGPLTGWAEVVDERTARFSAIDIPSRQLVEIRVVWPSGVVSGVPKTGESLVSIKEEEARFVRETISRVERARQDQEKKKQAWLKGLGAWGIWQIVGPIIWLIFYFRIWSRVGKDYRFEGLPEYYRELPSDLPPSFVQVLMREGRDITPAAFTATLFDLARRGWVRMEDRTVERKTLFGSKESVETRLTSTRDFDGNADLKPHEKDLLDLLFGKLGEPGDRKGSSLTLDNLKDYLKKEPQEFQKWYRDWTKQIKAETKPLGFLEPESVRARNIFLVVSLPVAILTFNIVLLVFAGVLIPTMKRRTQAWARENELWKAFRHFLNDFSEFRELPPEALKLWEHYLVFGILFGNAKKILKALPVILQSERATVPVWYAGANRTAFFSAGNLTGMINSIEHMATTVSQASTSAAHYSSGGGGGFSGGGGGGVGGGGGGAG
ncbi:MAG: DUF2207 domain-containing protein [Candidatus Aminicenantales bacterium]